MTWTHKFVRLADSVQDDVPGAADKHKLKCADLEEKKNFDWMESMLI